MSGEQAVPTGLLVHQGPGCLSPRVQTFICCGENGSDGNSDDLRFYVTPAEAVPEAVEKGAMDCPALWVDSAAVEAGSGALQVVYRLGGSPVCTRLPFKPMRLQPVKQGAGPGGAAYRAFVSSSTYTQAYRIAAGLLPKLHTLHEHLTSSGIPILGSLQPGCHGAKYSCDGLRAMPLHQGLLLERCDAAGQLTKLKINVNFHNACLELHDAAPDATTVNKCLRTINTLADVIVALEGRPGAGPTTVSPVKPTLRSSPRQSPAKPPLPSGLDSVRHGITLIQSCSAAQLREGIALLSAAAGSQQLAASAIIMGALEALVSAAASVLPSPTVGMAELHMLISQALTGLLDAAPPSAHAAARTVTVVAAVLHKNCANPLLLCKLLATLLQRPAVRLEAMHQRLATALSLAYARLSPSLEAQARAMLGSHGGWPGLTGGQAAGAAAAAPLMQPPAVVVSPASRPHAPVLDAAFGSPQVVASEGPVLSARRIAKPALSPSRLQLTVPEPSPPVDGHTGSHVAHLVATFNALEVEGCGSQCVTPRSDNEPLGAKQDSNAAGTPPRGMQGSSPARSVSAMSNASSKVPRLLLPALLESPTGSAGGLTRSTRRLGGTAGGRRSPSPTRFNSPVGSWAGPLNCDEGAEPAPSAELSAMAIALGEALMAADLPAIVAHKRRIDANLTADDELPPELLQPITPAARKQLEAHKIFVTARSLKSIDSSPTQTTGTGTTAVASQAGGTGLQLAEMEQIKCLLLEALLASLPVVGSLGFPEHDPSPLLAMEVLSTLGQSLSPQQEQIKQLCMQALQRLSQPGAPAAGSPQHVLLALAASKLVELVPQLGGSGAQGHGTMAGQAAELLQLMTEYVTAAPGGGVAATAIQYCSTAIQSLQGVLLAAGLDVTEWATGSWRMLHRLAALLAAVCSKCADPATGRALLRMLVADQQAATMLVNAASLALLHPEVVTSAGFAYRAGAALLQREVLHLLVELAALVGRQPPEPRQGAYYARAVSRLDSINSLGEDGSGSNPSDDLLLAPGPKSGKRLTRCQALQLLWPFISLHSGFVKRILDHEPPSKSKVAAPTTPAAPPSGDSMRLRHEVLQLLKVAFSAPGNPFVLDKSTTDFYIQFHFVQFLKLYHNPQRDHQALALCRKHMEVLLALASHRAPHSRKRFQQLSMMDFFVREVSLEFECSEPLAGRGGRVSWSGSSEPRRRSSSFSMEGDTTRRLSDRSCREGPRHPPSLAGGRTPEQHAAVTPPPVPALRLAARPAESTFSAQQHQQQQLLESTPGGTPASGLAIPRLNLPGTPPMGSPRGASSPPGPASSRLGRPPLPPSARSARTGRLGTPRTSRLGRQPGESHSHNSSPVRQELLVGGKAGSKQPVIIHVHAGPLPSTSEAATQPAQGAGRPVVPKLGLGLGRPGVALVPMPKLALASSPSSSEDHSPHGEQLPEEGREPGSARCEVEAGDSSDDEAAEAAAEAAGQQCASPALAVPVGFVWTGDLDEDVARLEAMEEEEEEAECLPIVEDFNEDDDDEAASPTIPAHRQPQFEASSPTSFRPGLPGLPRLALPVKASPTVAGSGQQQAASDSGKPLTIPRLNLTSSMHSTLETRTASAELQVALDAERAKRKVGRTYLGDLEKSALGKGKMQAVSLHNKSLMTERVGAVSLEVSYDDERGKRLLYRDEALHLQVLQLLFTLIFDGDGQLDPAYIDQLPWQRKMLNIPHILHHHLNHPDTRPLLARLLPLLHGMGPAAVRLLRVLCGSFFRPDWYSGSRAWIGKGAYAQVYRYQLPSWTNEGTVVFKVLDLPKHFEDHCRQVDFFSEVSIMEALSPSPCATQLIDFGIDTTADAMFLVMKDYRCSLRKWREAQPADPRGQLRLYLAIFQQVLSSVKSIMEANILHFDLKCDNVLLEPLPGVAEAELWAPQEAVPPFRVVLADFGESKLFTGSLDGAMTVRNRGTECAKSPEMLLAANASKKDTKTYDRRRREGAGAASDVWSLGCLLYELVTGQFLFSVEPDWVRFFVHITDPRSGQLITPDKAQAVQDLPGVLELLQFILVRDARLRPTLHDVQARVEALLHGTRVRLPSYMQPVVDAHAACGASPSSHRPLQSPTMLHSPKVGVPLPLAAPLPFAPGLVLAPISALQSAKALWQQPTVRRVVLLVGDIAALDCPPATSRTARVRALAPISNTLATASSGSPRQLQQQGQGQGQAVPVLELSGGSMGQGSCSSPCSRDGTPDSSPLRSGRYGSNASREPAQLGSLAENPVFSPIYGGPPASAAVLRLGTPREAVQASLTEPSVLALTAANSTPGEPSGGWRRSARPLFNSARVHAASATDVPAVFETARGAELGGCSEWPGSSQAAPRSQRSTTPTDSRPPSHRRSSSSSGAAPSSPAPFQPLLPPGFSESSGSSSGAARTPAEDAAYLHILSTPELARCGSACAAAGLECKVVPGLGGSGAVPASSPLKPPTPLHQWLRMALPVLAPPAALDCQENSGSGTGSSSARQEGRPPAATAAVMLACSPGAETELAVLAVAFLMRHRKLSLYQAMLHAVQWGLDLHLGEVHVRELQRWALAED